MTPAEAAGDGARIRVLHLEDDPLDAELAESTLASDGVDCEIERVATRADYEAALVVGTYDIILSDYNLPGFDGLTAQSIAKRLCPDVPFIFLSGALGEDLAADRLKDGATDFVLKQRMAKLPIAVRRAQAEAALRSKAHADEVALRALTRQLEERVRDREAELETFRRRLQAMLDYSPHWIEMKDLGGRFTLVNQRVSRTLNIPIEKIVGRKAEDVLAPRLADIMHAHDEQVIRDERPHEFEESMLEADGMHVYSSTRFPVFDSMGKMTGVCAIAHDISAQKHAEDEIKLARLEAMRANHAKSEFLSHMSHELRTPLNAILGFAQLFDLDALTVDQNENVSQILAAGRHLLDLINGILDIARVESGRLSISLEPVEISEAVRAAVDLVRPLARGRNITIEVCPLPDWHEHLAVQADKQRLVQVLLNLLSNAVKYNRADGRITINFADAGERRIRIAVIDTGAGIAPDKQKLLFLPFERLGAELTNVEGTGLGLAFSRALCRAMNGDLLVESVIDVGSTFSVDLALTDERPERFERAVESAVPETPVANRPARIVYIEDNNSNVRLMERMLGRRPNLTLLHVGDGTQGGAAVLRERPDLVLLDMHLPDITGEDVLQKLSAHPATRAIPVIVLSADASPHLPRRLEALGARAFLSKPLNVRQVLRVIDDVLAQRASS